MMIKRSSTLPAVWIIIAFFAVLSPETVRSQDQHGMHGHGHDGLHSWYLTLKQPGSGMSCCNNEDCRPTMSRVVDNAVQVEIDGEWTNVPPEKIVKTPSPDLGSHVCAPKQNKKLPKGHIYCVILGSGV